MVSMYLAKGQGYRESRLNHQGLGGPILHSLFYLHLSSDHDTIGLVSLAGVGTVLLCKQYCWLWPRNSERLCRERCHLRLGMGDKGTAAA